MSSYFIRIMSSHKSTFLISLIVIISITVRLLGVQSRPIWYDEAFSLLFSEKGPSAMLKGTITTTHIGSSDIHPITYYTFLWGWMLLFGRSIISARLLSILASAGIVLAIYSLGKELIDAKTARIGALFVALAPFQIHYAQEIRMYSPLTFF